MCDRVIVREGVSVTMESSPLLVPFCLALILMQVLESSPSINNVWGGNNKEG